MSVGFGMGAGLRALTAARLGMQTAGNNVSNANTPGYTRQRVELSSAAPFTVGRGIQMGVGVDVSGITRLVDEGLERRLRMQSGLVSAAQVDQARLGELESLFSEPDGGLSTGLGGFFGSISRLQTDPSDRALRSGVVQSANELAQNFNLLSRRMNELGSSTFEDVRGLVAQTNQLASSIASLNGQIISTEANGSTANDMRDTRAQQVRQLSELIDVNAIERDSGSVDLLVGGNLLVSGTRSSSLAVGRSASDTTQIQINGTSATIRPREGRIAALLASEGQSVPGYLSRVDQVAQNLIMEVNRRHTTGMPRSGPHQTLTSAYGSADGDGDGQRGDELLSQSDLPFDVQSGNLYVSVTNRTTGAITRTRIDVEPSAMTLDDIASALSDIEHLTATVDPTGRLRVAADSGFGFDFSPRLDPNPNQFGAFGGQTPSIGSSRSGPFDLSSQTFPVSFTVATGTATAPTTTTVTLDASDFANAAAATTEELAAAINADLGTQGTAADIGGRLVIRSNAGGSTAHLQLANVGAGTALTNLGLSTAATAGQNNAVSVAVTGAFDGAENGQLLFVPESDGQVGVTAGLRVRVLDQAGALVTTIDIGDDYEPGTAVDLGNGVSVAFGPGSISASAGHALELDVLADSDTSDLLVALGMNSFFLGTDASDIAVNEELRSNVDAFAAGLGTASGDAGNITRLMSLRESEVSDLDSNTIEDFWADVVGDIGFETEGAMQTLLAQDQLLQRLEAERESVSGVNLDEEMLDMVRFQQSFEAAARYLSTVQELTATLINLGQ